MKITVSFALLLSCAIPLLAAGPKTGEDNAQWITDLGGSVTRNAQGNITSVTLRGTWVGDSDLHRLNEYPDLSILDLSLTHITDEGMQEIKTLAGITELNLKLSTGVYGTTFYMLTGFHGFHVTLGAIMLTVIWLRCARGHFRPDHHFAFEGVAWYWHFVDVVWLGLFIFVYWL